MTTTSAPARSSSAPRRPRTRLRRDLAGGPAALLLILPVVALEVAILFAPLLYIAYRSFFDWQPGGVSEFTGFDNYVALFTDPAFWQVVGNQFFFLLGLPLWVIAPLIVAFMLREKVAGAGFFRSVYFLPAVMSPAVVALVFRSLLSVDGPVNALLRSIGLGAVARPWLSDEAAVKPVIILLVLWAGFGTGVLIFSAALSAVPKHLFEAARLDGVGFWGEFWHIAVPSIRSAVVLWMIFQVISIFLFMFSWVYVLTRGGPGLASATMDFAIYQEFMRFGFFGTAAAQSVVLVLFIVVIAAIGGVVVKMLGRERSQARKQVAV
ncbi:carbohydrate ABC transporter permease [Leucobacter soli]|uniref:Lactose transport system permease protein LacF n=1 Tax=Leucobacter soli TaxID=2812850 RepID=A0A916K338_9MICO|nr:sugar ABC transporter permease [Leucobacter soli]CAG7622555.1 Lactose transport system permease protein LacF [Leucobacter soli]